mmetsp:Transcript_43170/g.119400  ORF Transcript_43170/g.119400 Transcript_43170/m.119400 type:complete len:481 (+) Transcript_43170:84-1526(+)
MIAYSNEGCLGGVFFGLRGSVVPVSLLVAVPSALLAALLAVLSKHLEEIDALELELLKSTQLYSALLTTLGILIGFRTNKAYGRFWDATTLLHQMWGEWFDACSCLVAFSMLSKRSKPTEVHNFRHTLIRLMSLCHASALEEIAMSTDTAEAYPTLDLGGLDQGTLKYLRYCKSDKNLGFNRVEVIIHMIQTLVVHGQDVGVLKIPPPILSRVFQTLSRGQVNLANCKKITHTLFPFPYAQLIAVLLVVVTLLTPVVMAGVCKTPHWAFIFTVLPIFGSFSLNHVARQLEMPFGADANDLPMDGFQDNMNVSLLMLIREETDHVPCTSDRCAQDYDSTKEKISTLRPRALILTDSVHKPNIPEAKAPQVAPPAPAPPPPQPAIGEAVTMVLEAALKKSSEELSAKFQDLTTSLAELSSQLIRNTEVLKTSSQQRLQAKLEKENPEPQKRPRPHDGLIACAQISRADKGAFENGQPGQRKH